MSTGIFRAGWSELQRKWRRRSLQQQLTAHGRARDDLLVKLGDQALSSGVDLARHAAVRDALVQITAREGALSEASRALEADRARLQGKRREENARFDAERNVVETKRKAVDAQLGAARLKEAQQQSAARSTEAQQQSLPRELEQLRQKIASLHTTIAADRDNQVSAANARIAQIESALARLPEEARAAAAALAPLAADVARHNAESQRLVADIGRVELERRGVNQSIDAELSSTAAKLQQAGKDSQSVSQERQARLLELGSAIYADGGSDPRIADTTAAVAARDLHRESTQTALIASLAETQAAPSGALGKMITAVVAIVLVVAAIPVGGYLGWQWWKERQADQEYARQVEPAPLNPYLEHRLKDEPAYALANQLVDAKRADEAYAVLLKVFGAIGLGVYTPDGRQIQAGAEQSERDFFLYDFQARVLAATLIHPSYISFSNFSYVLGGTILELEQPVELEPLLTLAVARRYQQATANPKDPNNFIMLFMDGLARRQPIPYSLENSSSDYPVSPVQSILLVMEFFMGQQATAAEVPAAADTSALAWLAKPLLLIQSAHAQGGPCESIQGETDRKHYGWGIAAINELAEELPGRVAQIAKAFDKLTAGIEAMGDLLMLYGLDIHVQPQPYAVHLRHDAPVDAKIVATVTFDPQVVSDEVLKCGWMAGKQMPTKGPLADVETSWAFSRPLPPHLVMDSKTQVTAAGSLGLKTKTDRAGQSIFYMQASECTDRQGRILGQDYMAIVTARVVTTNIPSPTLMLPRVITKFAPGMLEYFMDGRKGYARFRAEWHKKRPQQPQYGT